MYKWIEVWAGTWQLVELTDEEYVMALAKQIMEEDHDLLIALRDA